MGQKKTIGMWNTSGLWQALTRQKEINGTQFCRNSHRMGLHSKWLGATEQSVIRLTDMLADRKLMMTDLFRYVLDNEVTHGGFHSQMQIAKVRPSLPVRILS